ncbi:hypothetical protein KBY83_00005, partial [Cyanobium sp. WKJ7-Wakatipu]|uniref:hypothetical protein n=1 Tax=Cyanobium sp. WKJ7-Wakatipu TaxID=2823726 RepID=UPI0020CCB2B4
MIIGSFSVQTGTSGNDTNFSITPGIAYFADSGDDTLFIRGSGELFLDGATWWIPSIASGGTGNDKYNIEYGTSTFIADASGSSFDRLRIFDYASNIDTFFSVDGRHIFMSTTWGTNVLLIDALNAYGAIETIEFQDITLSGSPQSAGSLLLTYQTMPGQSIESLISNGYFNPRAMGINDASEVRAIIKSLYDYTFTSNKTVGAVQFGSTVIGYALQNGVASPLSITNAGAVAGPVGGWSAFAAASTVTGYDLYWKNTNGSYAKWFLNSSAAQTSSAVISTAAFLQDETNLNVDLDGDGTTGLSFTPTKTVGAVQFGSTQLGYAIKNGAASPFQVSFSGQFASSANPGAGWSALAAAATGNGYELFWKNSVTGQYVR